VGRSQIDQDILGQGPALRCQIDHDQASVLGGRSSLDMTEGHQAIDRAGQGRPVRPDECRQGRHRRQPFLEQRVQHHPLAEDQAMQAQPVADQQSSRLFGLEKQSVQIVDVERQRRSPASPD
jgi:hypothetical protein